MGEYFSREWTMKNVMMMSDDDILEMKDQVEREQEGATKIMILVMIFN